MSDGEKDPSKTLSGLPIVSPENIRAFRDQEHPVRHTFDQLKRDNPAVAHEMLGNAKAYGKENIEQQRAYVEGALFLYALLAHSAESGQLRAMYELPLIDDDGEDPPPSA